MILNGSNGNSTLTGLNFEKITIGKNTNGIDLSKTKLYSYLKKNNIDYSKIISKKLLPDECYLDIENNELRIYEKKYQQVAGSADEKIQTCAFKILEFKKIADALNIKNVSYTYILSDWFKNECYKDVLEYIKTVPGCNYYFVND